MAHALWGTGPAAAVRSTLTLAGLALMLGAALVACGSGTVAREVRQVPTGTQSASPAQSPTQPQPASQRSEAGSVTVVVTWQGPSAGPVFEVVMDTHTVDLDGYDLRQLAILRTNDGGETRPTGWDAPKGGHHRKGTLTFPATAPDGSPLLGPSTRIVELVMRDIAGVSERSFQWTL